MASVSPKHVLEELGQHRITQDCLAALSGIGAGTLSRWLRGTAQLSTAAQFRIVETLNALIQVRYSSPLPIDYRQPEALRPAVERFRAQLSESDAARIEGEITAAGESASAGS